jgi:hypothetical protein
VADSECKSSKAACELSAIVKRSNDDKKAMRLIISNHLALMGLSNSSSAGLDPKKGLCKNSACGPSKIDVKFQIVKNGPVVVYVIETTVLWIL